MLQSLKWFSVFSPHTFPYVSPIFDIAINVDTGVDDRICLLIDRTSGKVIIYTTFDIFLLSSKQRRIYAGRSSIAWTLG